MAATSQASAAFAVPLLLVAVLATIVGIASAKSGTYFSTELMNNQRLTVPLRGGTLTPTQTLTVCKQKCLDHPDCDSYAYSGFHKTCQIYKMDKSNTAVIQNMYKLYVREKTNDEGYFKHDSDYIRLILTRKNAYDAAKDCANENGLLMTIVDKEMNKNATKIMKDLMVFSAIIGLTDQDVEGKWLTSLGTEATYTNFFFDGVWHRRDRNCAYLRMDKTWAQMNCLDKNYYFCQYPMF